MKPQDKTARYRFGDLRFGMAVPSKIGQRILHVFSPAVMNNEKMRKIDLQGYVGDNQTILRVCPNLKSVEGSLPKGLLLFLSHVEDADVSKKELVDFLNSSCSSAIGRKINYDELYEIGKRSREFDESGKVYKHYALILTNGRNGESSLINKDEVKEKLNLIDKFRGNDVDVLVGKKKIAEQFFKRNPGRFGELNDNDVYIFISVLGGNVLEKDVIEAINDVNFEMDNLLTDNAMFMPGDVKLIGQRMKKNPVSEKFEKYDMFAVRTTLKTNEK